MGPAEIGALIPVVALCIPIVAIWTKHRQKMDTRNNRDCGGGMIIWAFRR